MKRKNKMIYMPKLHDAMSESHNAYIKAMLGQSPKKYPNDLIPWEVFLWSKKHNYNTRTRLFNQSWYKC